MRSVPNCCSEASCKPCTVRRAGARFLGAPAMARRFQLGPDHQLRQMLGRLAPRIAFGDDPAQPHDRRPVAERLDLLQLVADVEDRAALLGQPAQGGEELRHLLRRQHRGRLVHDQQLGILQQAADDLDALALADREIMHAAVGIERQAIGLGDLDDPRLQAPAQPPDRRRRARCSRRRSGPRTARNAGTPCRCRAVGRNCGLGMRTGRPCQRISPASGCSTP